MAQALIDLRWTIWLWRVAIFRLFIHCYVVVATGFITGMNGQEWSSLSQFSKLMFIMGLSIQGANTITAFMDKTTAKIASGNFTPPDTGDTQSFTRVDTEIHQTTTSTPKNENTKPTINPLTDKPLNP